MIELTWQNLCLDPKANLLVNPIGTVLSAEELSYLDPAQMERFSNLTSIDRKREWSEARRLEKSIRESGCDLTSLSHSAGFVLAVGARRSDSLKGVGVDFEVASRKINPDVEARIIIPNEKTILGRLNPLAVWVAKEAVFKSDPANRENPSPRNLLRYYTILTYDPVSQNGSASGPTGGIFKFAWLHDSRRDWFVGFAVHRG